MRSSSHRETSTRCETGSRYTLCAAYGDGVGTWLQYEASTMQIKSHSNRTQTLQYNMYWLPARHFPLPKHGVLRKISTHILNDTFQMVIRHIIAETTQGYPYPVHKFDVVLTWTTPTSRVLVPTIIRSPLEMHWPHFSLGIYAINYTVRDLNLTYVL